jgi:hypothetical protein
MALHFRIPPVTAGVHNGPLQLPDTLDFQETETVGKRILNFLQHFSYNVLIVLSFYNENPL